MSISYQVKAVPHGVFALTCEELRRRTRVTVVGVGPFEVRLPEHAPKGCKVTVVNDIGANLGVRLGRQGKTAEPPFSTEEVAWVDGFWRVVALQENVVLHAGQEIVITLVHRNERIRLTGNARGARVSVRGGEPQPQNPEREVRIDNATNSALPITFEGRRGGTRTLPREGEAEGRWEEEFNGSDLVLAGWDFFDIHD